VTGVGVTGLGAGVAPAGSAGAAAAAGPLKAGDVLLVKGSRVAALEQVSDMVASGAAGS
jgi:hypothetical protein